MLASANLCQVGLSSESWKLLERHLHKYAFQNSGHKLPNSEFVNVCLLIVMYTTHVLHVCMNIPGS